MPPRGKSSPKSRRASRENGKLGAEHGAKGGRPRKKLPRAIVDELKSDPPPVDDPLEMMRWYTRWIAKMLYYLGRGDDVAWYLAELERASAYASKVLPFDAIMRADQLLRDDEADMNDSGAGPEVVARRRG